jgi:hypothetical protein
MLDPLQRGVINFVPVDGCQLNCPRCCARPGRWLGRDTLEIQQYAGNLREAERRGFKRLVFSGGEPGLWSELPAAVGLAKSKSLHVRVFTNGVNIPAERYGNADEVRISDYGGINKLDILRLRNALGRRLGIKWPVQVDMPAEPVSGPVRCNGAVPTIIGGRLYGCAVQATRDAGPSVKVESDWGQLPDPRRSNMCLRCLDNMTVRALVAPRMMFQWCLPETNTGRIWQWPWRTGWAWKVRTGHGWPWSRLDAPVHEDHR